MTKQLEIVRAGAGSGKTTDLCDTVAKAVQAGLDPARILATTFTRKAAAELKGRIQTKLLEGTDGNWARAHHHADRLDLAAIGTVHSVAHQLLVRYALPLGLSLRLKVLIESGSDHVLRDLMGMMSGDGLDRLGEVADRLSIDNLHPLMLQLLAVKRGNRMDDAGFRAQLAASAERVCLLLAPDGPAATTVTSQMLYEAIEEALGQIEQIKTDTTNKTRDVVTALRRLLASKDASWGAFFKASKVTAGKPSGADNHLSPVRSYVAAVRKSPKLHDDIRRFNSILAEQVIELEGHYRSYKRERGLVDFTDLELTLLQLLVTPDLESSLREDFDLVLVDEFQDTNPLQLSIFQALLRVARRNRWVGDPKQAIYGFRETDPQLVNDVWENAENATRETLQSNYRSQKGIVQLVGKLFSPHFGPETAQIPRKESKPEGVERWILDSSNQQGDCLALACGIVRLRDEGVRLGDIAVLERKNRSLDQLAEQLDALGIPFLMESPGLLSTREGAVILCGLQLVADRYDSLAAATILHVLDDPDVTTPHWLAERLTAVRAAQAAGDGSGRTPRPWEGDSRFELLDEIDATSLTPLMVVQQVIEALDVPHLVSTWGEAARRASHVDSILRHAAEYEEWSRENGTATTLTGLILYFEELVADRRDTRLPPLGHDAVTLLTYHSAKGLEWPVVILSGLASENEPDLWRPTVALGPATAGTPAARTLRAWTWPFGKSDGPFPKPLSGSGLEGDALASPEGQSQLAREVEESLRLLYVGFTRAKDKIVLAHRGDRYEWLKRVSSIDEVLNPSLREGRHSLPDIETDYVVRRLSPDMSESCRIPARDRERWLPSIPRRRSADIAQRHRTPTEVVYLEPVPSFAMATLPGTSYFPSGAKEEQYAAIGDAVHTYMAALPSMIGMAADAKERVALTCLTEFRVNALLTPDVLVACGTRFEEWVGKTFPGAEWSTEVPVTAPHAESGQWSGAIDLLLWLPDKTVVLIDHKSAPIRREACADKAMTFANQLFAYQDILKALDVPVAATFIHFPMPGVVAELTVGKR